MEPSRIQDDTRECISLASSAHTEISNVVYSGLYITVPTKAPERYLLANTLPSKPHRGVGNRVRYPAEHVGNVRIFVARAGMVYFAFGYDLFCATQPLKYFSSLFGMNRNSKTHAACFCFHARLVRYVVGLMWCAWLHDVALHHCMTSLRRIRVCAVLYLCTISSMRQTTEVTRF